MNRLIWKFKRQRVVEEAIASEIPNNEPEDEPTPVPVPLPGRYETFKLRHSDGPVLASRPNLGSWQTADQISVTPSNRADPSVGGSRTVISRTSDGTLVRVQRPARNSAPAARAPCRVSRSSSIYSGTPERDSTRSTVTIVDATLADQRFSQTRRHSRRDGSATTTASGTAISGTSGDIHIGHIEEVDVIGTGYISSDHDEKHSISPEERQSADAIPTSGYRHTYDTGDLLGSRAFAPPQKDSFAAQGYITPPSYKTYSYRGDTPSWGYTAKLRAEERRAMHSPARIHSKNTWTRRLIHGGLYLMASCSIVLPAMFLVLGILIVFMNQKPVSSTWSTTRGLIDVAAAIWPLVFAAVAAQCFKTWHIYQNNQRNQIPGAIRGPERHSPPYQRLELMCLLMFLIWSLSPFGSEALANICGSSVEVQHNAINLWYVDRTGYNTMWSAKSTSDMSAASRSELVQAVSERYISSLAPDTMTPAQTSDTTTRYSLPFPVLSGSNVSSPGLIIGATASSSLLSSRDLGDGSSLDTVVGTTPQSLSFTMTLSYFNLTCGSWETMLRNSENDTSENRMSYSAGQTLGMSMATGDHDNVASAGGIDFVSLNSINNGTGTALLNKDQTGTAQYDKWEYSVIHCDYQQFFYSVPVQCDTANGTNVGACYQSAKEGLMVTSMAGRAGTDLGDFAKEFVSADFASAGTSVTATEGYIRDGGAVNPTSSALLKDDNASSNLSATVSPDEFAQRFGQLFNTWVSLGYCPECTSDILAGNDTAIPPNLQPSYRQAIAAAAYPGVEVYTIEWAWLAVFLVFTTVLLAAGIASVTVESVASTRALVQRRNGVRLEDEGDLLELQLPRTYSGFPLGSDEPKL